MWKSYSNLTALLLSAGIANALMPNVDHDRRDIHRRQQSPCAQLSNALIDNIVPAQLALSCLRTVPLQNETSIAQLDGLRIFLQFQSDLSYLNSSQPARLYPGVDLIAGLDTLEQRLRDSFYSNEYDFQSDISRLLASAYDGHLVYVPDIVGSFTFAHVGNDGPYSLISVSSDGTSLPSIYAATDRAALSGGASYEPSQITEIDGRNVEDFLNNHAALTGSSHDPDANYNSLFPNDLKRQFRPVPGRFEEFRLLQGTAEETVLSFQNGTEERLQLVAASPINLSGLSDGEDFFERCCSGSFLSDLPPPSNSPLSRPTKRSTQALLKTVLDDPRMRHLHDEQRNTHITWDAHHAHTLRPRQQGPTQASVFPEPILSLDDGSIAGYFPESIPDLAVLAVSSFLPSGAPLTATEDFQSLARQFLDRAGRAEKSRLVIDLRGNGGGYGFLAHDLFRQLFPTANPYDGSNYPANRLFDLTGQSISQLYEDRTPPDFFVPENAPPLFSGAYPFNYRQQLDINNETFTSWSDFFGPETVPSSNDNFTAITRPDLNDVFQTGFPIYPLRQRVVSNIIFSPTNILLLQDGVCASACALFTEFMKTNAPTSDSQPIQSIVVGGRKQEGPMQSTGGVKGGQLSGMIEIGAAVLFALESGTLARQIQFASEFGRAQLLSAFTALDRANAIDDTTLQASVNFRNQIREGDDESVLPLQYVYEAANCRFFYTAQMYGEQERVWERAYQIAWENGSCVAGSEGHVSAGRGTDYANFEVPDNARSSFGVGISGEGDAGRIGGAPAGNQEESTEESAALKIGLGGWELMAVSFGVLLSMLYY